MTDINVELKSISIEKGSEAIKNYSFDGVFRTGNIGNATLDFESFDLSPEKLAIVLGITFAFILLLLLSLICIFYLMGLLQNVFGYSWSRPMGRTFSTVHSSRTSSSQNIAVDSNCNLYDPRSVNQQSTNVTTVAIPGRHSEQCYMCTAIACNGNALGLYPPNGNIRSC